VSRLCVPSHDVLLTIAPIRFLSDQSEVSRSGASDSTGCAAALVTGTHVGLEHYRRKIKGAGEQCPPLGVAGLEFDLFDARICVTSSVSQDHHRPRPHIGHQPRPWATVTRSHSSLKLCKSQTTEDANAQRGHSPCTCNGSPSTVSRLR